jgi:hypothetical protein
LLPLVNSTPPQNRLHQPEICRPYVIICPLAPVASRVMGASSFSTWSFPPSEIRPEVRAQFSGASTWASLGDLRDLRVETLPPRDSASPREKCLVAAPPRLVSSVASLPCRYSWFLPTSIYSPLQFRHNRQCRNDLPRNQPIYSPRRQISARFGDLIALDNANSQANSDILAGIIHRAAQTPGDKIAVSLCRVVTTTSKDDHHQ